MIVESEREDVLFVGGPLDGQTRNVSVFVDYVRHYEPPARSFATSHDPEIPVRSIADSLHKYRRRGNERVFVLC